MLEIYTVLNSVSQETLLTDPYVADLDSSLMSMLTGMELMPMAMLMAHSTPLMGCTLKKRPTGVCMMMTCRRAVWGRGGEVIAHMTQSRCTAGKCFSRASGVQGAFVADNLSHCPKHTVGCC